MRQCIIVYVKSIVVTSGKGGVGKTTVTACLGRALAELGCRVVLIDADFGLNNLDVVLGAENSVVYDIADVLSNRARVRQALIEIAHDLFLLPSAHGYLGERVTAQNIKLILKSLSPSFDYALVDCPAGIEAGFKRAVVSCEHAITVTTPHISAIRDANKVINLLTSYRIKPMLVVNRMRGDLLVGGKIPSAAEISDMLRTELLGVAPETDGVYGFTKIQKKPFEAMARRLHLGADEIFDPAAGYRGFFGAFKRRFGR